MGPNKDGGHDPGAWTFGLYLRTVKSIASTGFMISLNGGGGEWTRVRKTYLMEVVGGLTYV